MEKEYYIIIKMMRNKGDFKNDKFEGKGIYYYNNGDKYEGDFKNDKREGNWINDEIEKKGIFKFW